MRHVQSAGAVVLALVVAALATGCATDLQDTDPGLQQEWQQLQAQYPGTQRPDVDVVRVVDKEDWAEAIVDCLLDAGFPGVAAGVDGSISWQASSERAADFALAKYVCAAQYPIDPKYTEPLTDAQIGTLYDYYVTEQVPCLEGLGVAVEPPPTRSDFIASYRAGPEWLPYLSLTEKQLVDGEVARACPQEPARGSEFYLY